jgi:hypothetical protein
MLQPARDVMHPVQFHRGPNPLYDPEAPPAAPSGHERDDMPVTNVPVGSLVSAQETVDTKKVAKFKKGDMDDAPPVDVLRWGSKHIVIDGNHRGVVADSRGERTIPAKIKGDISYIPRRRR